MRAELVFTGSELLMGYVQNTDAQFLSTELAKLGIEVALHTTVGDDWDAMVRVIGDALERSDMVITTGGLGPTTDDITKEVVAHLLGVPMVTDEASLAQIRSFFRKRGREMPAVCERQAVFPAGAQILPNYKGTAPGALLQKDGKVIVILPGPLKEVTAMFRTAVLPHLAKIPGRGEVLRTRVLKLTGIAEYAVQELIKDLGGQGNPGVGYLAVPGEVQLRVSARHPEAEVAEGMVEELAAKVLNAVGEYVFGVDDEQLEKSIARLLIDKGLTISAAESCTAGMLAARLTDIPGSSRYFVGGVVAYSNDIKTGILGVPRETLALHGAVSEQTAVAMAKGVQNLTGSDLGIAVTGIAGPGGATPDKPVGLVYGALTTGDETICRRFQLPGERIGVRVGTVNSALNMVKRYLEK